MKIEQVIQEMKALQKAGETDVAIGWWSRGIMEKQLLERELTKKEYADIAELVDDSDWSDKNEDIVRIAGDYLAE